MVQVDGEQYVVFEVIQLQVQLINTGDRDTLRVLFYHSVLCIFF